MKKNISLSTAIIALLSVVLTCCIDTLKQVPKTSQPELTNEEMKRLVLLDTNYTYSEAVAKETAMQVARQMNDGQARSILNVITFPSVYTLTGKTSIATDYKISKPQTPSLHVVNFKNQKGFVVLSADKRAPEILATVKTNNVDSASHLGLRIFLDNAISYMDKKVAESEALRGDATFKSLINKLSKALLKQKPTPTDKPNAVGKIESTPCASQSLYVPGVSSTPCNGGNTCQSYIFTTPILSQVFTSFVHDQIIQTIWGQDAPFNSEFPGTKCNTGNLSCGNGGNNNKCLVGCVPIAEGQIIAHFLAKKDEKWKAILSKNKCDYSSSDISTVSNLLKNILFFYVNRITLGCDQTSVTQPNSDATTSSLAPWAISPAFGLHTGEWRPYSENDIRSSLGLGYPVIITGSQHLGCAFFSWGCWGYGDKHEWIIDGMRDTGIKTTYQVVTSYFGDTYCSNLPSDSYTYTLFNTTSTSVHYNWGFDGNADGYYSIGTFLPAGHTQDYNFDHANYIIVNISPL